MSKNKNKVNNKPLQRPSKFLNITTAERLRNIFLTTPPRFFAPQISYQIDTDLRVCMTKMRQCSMGQSVS